MSSSISSSDTAEWGSWLATFVGALAVGCALVFALVLIVDPYDSGRVGVLGIRGVSDPSPRTANASRARDPQFNSAVIGNSTGQLLSPAELSRLTGARFVQLTVPGTGAREQLSILKFFVRHHPRMGALVIVTDTRWCSRDPALPEEFPFPFWLYGESTLDYVGRLFSSRAAGNAWRRILIGLGMRRPSAPEGYWDYEVAGPQEFQPVIAPRDESALAGPIKGAGGFPAVAVLGDVIKRLSAEVPVVLVVPPTFYTLIPLPGSATAMEADACKAALRDLVAGRAHSNFIDFRVDNAVTREPAHFMDSLHYRAKIARQMEKGIADSIRVGDKAVIDF